MGGIPILTTVKTASTVALNGATYRNGLTEFRVWAPAAHKITLRLLRGGGREPQDFPMRRLGSSDYGISEMGDVRDADTFVLEIDARPGDRYFYIIDDGSPIPDPVSRCLPEGVHGPTEIVDPTAFEWKDRNWRLDLFGSGSDERYIQDVIRYFGLEDRVRLCGYEREFIKIWMDHHLYILISRAEGLALALIESMFCGRPAVVTRTGGNHELLRDNEDGFVTAGEHPEVIRETLERAWINRQRWPEMGKTAFQRANDWVPKDLSVRLFQTICDSSSRSMS